ncbi:MAG: hypothetical protein KF773_39180 [Deltaproteobacteria bacterium]|nr:hypothetical protein [Deltaproteobacteria bacterium]MCW5805873.1 hypothetical protein [Deltaproteobacteria bacterium]
MELSDAQYRMAVVGAGVVLALGIGSVRFCGSVSLPPKPQPPVASSAGGAEELRRKAQVSPGVYQDWLQRDAAAASVRTPTLDEMSRKFVNRVDEGRHVLEVGQPAIDTAGLRLVALRSGNAIVLDILNTTDSDLAYHVQSEPAPMISECATVPALGFNAMVIEKRQHEVRVECAYRDQMAIVIKRVETIELPPLPAFYVSQLPPELVGIEERLARGHRPPRKATRCSNLVSQAVRTGLETGEIGWRDLVDFYARHRCQTYQFPLSYRMFTTNGQRSLPAEPDGM